MDLQTPDSRAQLRRLRKKQSKVASPDFDGAPSASVPVKPDIEVLDDGDHIPDWISEEVYLWMIAGLGVEEQEDPADLVPVETVMVSDVSYSSVLGDFTIGDVDLTDTVPYAVPSIVKEDPVESLDARWAAMSLQQEAWDLELAIARSLQEM